MRRLVGAGLLALTALVASAGTAHAYPRWGDPPYPDPAGFCTSDSPMWKYPYPLQSNDPSVPNNPEKDTFWGVHPNPGYDWWYVRLYGDFRGKYDDDSGWVQLFKVYYPNKRSWNLPLNGWFVHGHVTT